MNRFFVLCVASIVGLFAITQSLTLVSIFDYYFYLLPFGLALVGLFLAAGIRHLPLFSSINGGIVQALPVFGAFAMLMCVGLYLYAAAIGPSIFFLLLVIVQSMTYVFLWLVIVRGEQLVSSIAGVMIGLAFGYIFIGYLNIDPLVIILIACVFTGALYVAHFTTKTQGFPYLLIVCFVAFAVFQAREYHVMPDSLGWLLDHGKAGSENVNKNSVKRIWGPAGVSEIYAVGADGSAAWLYTNGSSPGLVLTDELTGYDNAWWAQKAPLAMAIHDAVRPKSVIDIGVVPSDMAWRTLGQGGRNIYGLYGSHDWSLLPVPGLDLIRKSVVLVQQPRLSAEKKVKLPVDMVVLSSGHEGKGGWVSSNGGEQTFLNNENILSYWRALDKEGVLVLLSRQEAVFLKQLFSVWTALNDIGISDAEFLDRAWGVVPDTATSESPYRYALVITRRARDEKFAQAIRSQVLKLPVRYLFGYDIPPSSPYNVIYQNDRARVQEIFTLAASRMFGKQMTLDVSETHKSMPYQFVEDVFPQYKNMLVLSVGILIGVILFPLQKLRRIEYIEILRGPGAATWMVTGGAAGASTAVALAYLMVYPSSITQEFRLLYLLALLPVALFIPKVVARADRSVLLLVFASALGIAVYLVAGFVQMTTDDSKLYVGAAGILLVLIGVSLHAMQSTLMRDSEVALVRWWWFAMAAGSAAALFWSMRLYSALGDGLLLIAGLLLMGVAGVFWWHGHSHSGKVNERHSGGCNPVMRVGDELEGR